VVGDVPQLSEFAKWLLVDHACISSLEVVKSATEMLQTVSYQGFAPRSAKELSRILDQ